MAKKARFSKHAPSVMKKQFPGDEKCCPVCGSLGSFWDTTSGAKMCGKCESTFTHFGHTNKAANEYYHAKEYGLACEPVENLGHGCAPCPFGIRYFTKKIKPFIRTDES